MLYIDYHWDLSPNLIVPDKELDTDQLKWRAGDFWQMVDINGKLRLQKVDPMLQFLLEGNNRGCS